MNPHIKSRSQAQKEVVGVCLELRQPQRARRYIEHIGGWRKAEAYADLAFYYAKQGMPKDAVLYLIQADPCTQEVEDWQKDRINSRIAQVYTLLKQTEVAVSFERGLAESESGKVDRVRAMICPSETFEDVLHELERLTLGRQADVLRNALDTYAELYNRFYTDIDRRETVEKAIRNSWEGLPIVIRIDLLKILAEHSLSHKDKAKALELVDEAQGLLDSATWQPQYQIPLMARLTALRFRAGERDQARAMAGEALNLFTAKRGQIVNIYRAGMLRSMAEAYRVMGDTSASLDLYRRAIEAGTENPNSRPRAEDLAATCCSMALYAVAPDDELWSRIRAVHKGLGDPW